jgi:Zn-finger nucleic acid-binding protein
MPVPPTPADTEQSVRHASGVLVCPRCAIPLGGREHELGIAWRCGKCRGQSLNFSQFRRMVPEHGARDIWLEAMKHPSVPSRRTRCPECLAAMDAVLIPFRGRSIELEICLPCQRLWLDAQEDAGGGVMRLIP